MGMVGTATMSRLVRTLPSFRVRNRLVSFRIRGIGTLRSLRGVGVILVWAFIRPTLIAMPVRSFFGFLVLGFIHLGPSVDTVSCNIPQTSTALQGRDCEGADPERQWVSG